MRKPNSARRLDDSLRKLCGGTTQSYVQARTIMANAIVASMLPDGVIKGGSALKMRYGNSETRFTTDLDTATAMEPDHYAACLGEKLKVGWEGFTGRVIARSPASPEGVPSEYIMRSYDVKLDYLGKAWCTVSLEVGHNEIDDASEADWAETEDARRLFESMGFPTPAKAPLMTLEHQIAQKLHAVSSVGDRAKDLVDLQLIVARTNVELSEVRVTCERLFAYRKAQAWPPTIVKQKNWKELYARAASGLPVIEEVDAAVEWANNLVAAIRDAK